MKTFKGSPGPWAVKHSQSKKAFNVIGTKPGSKYKIARCPYYTDSRLPEKHNNREIQEALADAKLIAEAPELFKHCGILSEELTRCLNLLSKYRESVETDYQPCFEAEATISKILDV